MPEANLIDKPAELSFVEAACLPTAWLTAYRMLFTQSGLQPGNTVLVQGAGGGVATALIVLAHQAGFRVWVTSRSESRAARAVDLGAAESFPSGARLPERVDAVMETVGAATWSHSINALKPGGTLVICGATSGDNPAKAELTKIFFRPLRVIGSTMGTRDELTSLTRMLVATGIRPVINRDAAADGGPRRLCRHDQRRRLRQDRPRTMSVRGGRARRTPRSPGRCPLSPGVLAGGVPGSLTPRRLAEITA